ncbi:hypothetical protein [Streptomyces sp. JW3]|uniref:hypothetical protein n=1 Tax=Streptomyces sp. JW3 TaxID=3456955 RepID=UPI003FA433DD
MSAAYGQQPRAEVWQRIRINLLGLSLLLAAMCGLGSLALLFVGGAVFVGIAGPLLMAGAAVAAVKGYRNRVWSWSIVALGADVVWFAVMALLLN